jgi:hypothetical protein
MSEEEEAQLDTRIWAFDYQARKYPKGPYEKKQVTDNAYNIYVRRVKFLKWTQEPGQVNYVGVVGRPYCLPGQAGVAKLSIK